MLRFLKRQPKPRPPVSETKRHQDRLRWFLRRETALGCYGSQGDLDAVREAIAHFAYLDLEAAERGEAQSDG